MLSPAQSASHLLVIPAEYPGTSHLRKGNSKRVKDGPSAQLGDSPFGTNRFGLPWRSDGPGAEGGPQHVQMGVRMRPGAPLARSTHQAHVAEELLGRGLIPRTPLLHRAMSALFAMPPLRRHAATTMPAGKRPGARERPCKALAPTNCRGRRLP